MIVGRLLLAKVSSADGYHGEEVFISYSLPLSGSLHQDIPVAVLRDSLVKNIGVKQVEVQSLVVYQKVGMLHTLESSLSY